MSDQQLYSSSEAADLLGVTRKKVENWVTHEYLAPTKTENRRNFFSREVLEGFAIARGITIRDGKPTDSTTDIATPLVPGPNDLPTAKVCELLDTSPTTIKRLIEQGKLHPKRIAIGGGRPKMFFDKQEVIEVSRTLELSAAHVKAGASSGARTKVKPKRKSKARPATAKAAKEVRTPAAAAPPSADEGKRLILAFATLQEIFDKPDSEVWAELLAWAKR